jgi:hypothetical protein
MLLDHALSIQVHPSVGATEQIVDTRRDLVPLVDLFFAVSQLQSQDDVALGLKLHRLMSHSLIMYDDKNGKRGGTYLSPKLGLHPEVL